MLTSSLFQFLFQQLGMLVSFVKSHIRPYMDEIVTLMRVSRNECFGPFLGVWVQERLEAGLDDVDMFFMGRHRAVTT